MSPYSEGLLDAQRLANEHARDADERGRTEARDALFALSSELVRLREGHEAAAVRS